MEKGLDVLRGQLALGKKRRERGVCRGTLKAAERRGGRGPQHVREAKEGPVGAVVRGYAAHPLTAPDGFGKLAQGGVAFKDALLLKRTAAHGAFAARRVLLAVCSRRSSGRGCGRLCGRRHGPGRQLLAAQLDQTARHAGKA